MSAIQWRCWGNLMHLKFILDLLNMVIIILCLEKKKLHLGIFNFSFVSVSRSPNSGQGVTCTARKIRAYYG